MNRPAPPRPPAPRRERGLAALAAGLTAAIFALSLRAPFEVAVGSLYVLVVLLGLRARDARFGLIAAAAATLGIGASAALVPPGEHLVTGLANRALSAAIVWVTAFLVRQYRRAAREAERAAEQAQRYLEVAGVILVALDRDGRVLMINRQGANLLGYDEREIVGTNWFERFVPARLRDELRAVRERVEAGSGVEYYENPVVTRSGEERLIAWHNTVLRDENGAVVGTLSSGTDITERRDAERRLQATVKDLGDLKYALDQSAIVAITDVAGRIKYVNDKFCEISKYTREELLGEDHRLINSRYHSKEFFRTLWQTIAAGHIWRGEIRNRAKDGSLYWVDTTIVPFLDERGKPYQYMAIHTDITERKRTEAKLREQTTLARLGEMAAIVAHEVKNPLAGIRGAIQIIASRLPVDHRDRAILKDIQERLDALNELLEDLLLFARPKEPRTAPADIRPLVEATVGLLKKDPGMAGVEVTVRGDSPTILADAEQLRRVFLNLLINAGQAMGGRGRIDVTITASNGRCEVVVQDEGPGIPPDVLERVFEPFFTTKHRGTGLGLPTARRIVERHGGTLELASWPGTGTRVVVSLPLPPPVE
jgi:PAS domain S-box-containing protein